MQILLKWRISVFVMLVLKKRIRFTESLPLPDFEGSLTNSRIYDDDHREKKDPFMQPMPVMKLQRRSWWFFRTEIYKTMLIIHVLKKKKLVDFFKIISSLLCGLSLYVYCFFMHLICLSSLFEWDNMIEAFFFGRLKSIYKLPSCHDFHYMKFTHPSLTPFVSTFDTFF